MDRKKVITLYNFTWVNTNNQFSLDPSSPESTTNECVQEDLSNYNLGLRIGALFIILATSAIGMNKKMK